MQLDSHMIMGTEDEGHKVNFSTPRSFGTVFNSHVKEILFPDDPFKQFKQEKTNFGVARKALEYFVPIFQWLPKYNLKLFRYDILAGITITCIAIPQGICYANLANIPPIIGLYCSFVPPIIYTIFGSSKHIAVGTIAASSLLIGKTIESVVPKNDNPTLYLHLVFTSACITGIFQAVLGILRLGIIVDFLSHSTITGFMGGTAILIILQQLKDFTGMKSFPKKTDIVSVLHAVFEHKDEWIWQTITLGLISLFFLQFTQYLAKRKPKLFWISATAPLMVIVAGCLFSYFANADKYGIKIVGHLRKGLNPLSIKYLNFNSKYLPYTMKAGMITAMIALAEGISIARSFALMKNEQIDGNKEMIAFGLMNIAGSFTSCYLTTGPFSKTAVNFNAGCRTAMSNIVMAFCMMLILLFLAPLFSYTPLVSLAAVIISAMVGLIKYKKAYHLVKVDKFDFCICMSAFFGVAFIGMDFGLAISIGLSMLRALLYVARPASCKLGKLPDSVLYRDIEQYPESTRVPGILALQFGSPIYFINSNYIRERILRWIRDEQSISNFKENAIEYLILDLSGVTSIDTTGIETLIEICRMLEAKEIKMAIANPRVEVLEKMIRSKFVDKIGKESIFLCVEDAVQAKVFSSSK